MIREELTRIVRQRAATDPHLHYFDGLDLYSKTDHAERPLPDEFHPDSATHQHIGERFARLAFGDGGPFTTEHRRPANDRTKVKSVPAPVGTPA